MPRRYSSPKREAAALQTRQAILLAFIRQLGRPGAVDVSIREAAAEAGVAVRTVHHHFPDRESRIAALAAWAEGRFGPLAAPLEVPDELPGYVRAAYARAGRELELTRALYQNALGNAVRVRRLGALRARIHAVLRGIGADPEETERAAAVVGMLASAEAGIPLVDLHGLSLEQAAEAAAEAVEAIVLRLRQNAAVGRRQV